MLDEVSCSVLFIKSLCGGNVMSPAATGFVYRKHNGLYDESFLVTNFHVLSGVSLETLNPVNERSFTPDAIKVRLLEFQKNPDGSGILKHSDVDIPIGEFAKGTDVWWCHPDFMKNKADIAAIPLAKLSNINFPKPINVIANNCPAHPHPGTDAFVVGFPLGINASQLPIWKRASIASEFHAPFEGDRKFLVDTSTREGMSGSPVIYRSYNGYVTENGSTIIASGKSSRFLGIYCGRLKIGSDPFGSQLGVVWHAELIDEIIQGRRTYSSIVG